MFSNTTKATSNRRGSVLIAAAMLAVVVSIACVGILLLSQFSYRMVHRRDHRADAYFTAENILLEGARIIAESSDAKNWTTPRTYKLRAGDSGQHQLSLPYSPGNEVVGGTLSIQRIPGPQDNYFRVIASAGVGAEDRRQTRVLMGDVIKGPPAEVFDYIYFLNNWGWWWGGSINGYGDIRSNWDFDFRYDPTVWGHAYCNGDITYNNGNSTWDPSKPSPIRGHSQGDPSGYLHPGVPRVNMPRLKDLTAYESLAAEKGGTIRQNGATLVDQVQGDDAGEKTGIYLEGTDANPIEINGTVVIRGDVIIKGKITGQGTLYIGGNLYLADDVQYANGPNFSDLRNAMKVSDETARMRARDSWVEGAMDTGKDLIAFAVNERILGGKVNSSAWKSNCYDAGTYGLKHIGSERNLGEDGIRGTADDGVPYLDLNGDGAPDSAWYDVDGDGYGGKPGEEDYDNYSYNDDLKLTSARIDNIEGYPTDHSGAPVDYNDVADDRIKNIQGVYYTNHALGHYTRSGPDYFDGGLICRDEAWIFSSSLHVTYEDRIHSRNHKKYFNGDPNAIIDLDLPTAEDVRFADRWEQGFK